MRRPPSAYGWRVTGSSIPASPSDTDTVVASAKAYVNALNRLVMHQHRGNLSALMSSAG